MYLISTFPSLRLDINEYPAIKKHLLSFGKERLEQSGKHYKLNGNDIVSRKKTGNDWFETQDQISYWQEFGKPKIIYPNMTKYLPFVYDREGYYTNQKCFIITGENIAFLTSFFNSSIFKYCFRENFPELQGGTRELSKIFFEKISVKKITSSQNSIFESMLLKIQDLKFKEEDAKILEKEIDALIFDLYDLTIPEREAIGFIEIK